MARPESTLPDTAPLRQTTPWFVTRIPLSRYTKNMAFSAPVAIGENASSLVALLGLAMAD
jgi:hypothetical protein